MRKSAAKADRKKFLLKRGSPYEDLALLKSLSDLALNADAHYDEVGELLLLLVRLDLWPEAKMLQQSYAHLMSAVGERVDRVWPLLVERHMFPGPLMASDGEKFTLDPLML